MDRVAAVRKVLGRTNRMATPRRSSSSTNLSYGVSDPFSMVELPHPERNLTVSRVVIMVTVAVLVGALTVSTWYFTHSYPKSAVTSLSESLRLEILVNTSELLDVIFKMNTYSSTALLNLMEKKFFGTDFGAGSIEQIRLVTWSIFQAVPTITSLGVTAMNGVTAAYVRQELGHPGHLFLYSNMTTEKPTYYKEVVDADTGDSIAPPTVEDLMPLHTYQWFVDAMKVPLNNRSWLIERKTPNGHPFIQCSIPVQSHNTKELALIHSGHSAQAINKFLASLDLKGGRIFISDQLGRLLFSSDATVCAPQNKTQCEVAPLQTDSVLNDCRHFLENEVGLQYLIENRTSFADVNIRGKRYSIDSWPYEFQTLKLAVVIMIPRHSFWGPMDYYTRITWITLPLLSLGVVFIGCSLIYLLVEQVQAEEKLRAEILRQSEAKRRAEASRDAKTNFLSSMSHELRTPMACIIGLLDMLLSEKLLDEIANSVRQIHRCATSLVAILNSALDIAKVESGKLVLEKAEFDLEAELTALIDVFSVQCDNKDLFICFQLADDVPKNVVGDSARVMQVFTNLIGNSIKFTSNGRISVRARLATIDPSGNSSRLRRRSFSSFSTDIIYNDYLPTSDEVVILFEVDDTGPGIEPALRERIFENFVQGDASTTRTHGGTGLGLGIVKSLVHIMGGNIRILEKTGPGSVFQFTICFERSSKPERPPYVLPSSLEGAEIILGIPNADCRAVAAHWVKTWGLVAHEVDTWEEIIIKMRALNGIPVDTKTASKGFVQRHHSDSTYPLSIGLDKFPKSPKSSTRKRSSRYDFWKSWQSIGGKGLSGQARQILIIDISLLPTIVEHGRLEEYLQQSGFLTGNSAVYRDALGLEKLHLNDRHLTDMQRNLLVVWVTASNTPEPVKAALRSVRNSIAVRRPLHETRLKELLHQIATEVGDCLVTMDSERPRILSSNALAYAKQQEWDDPYRCDTEVSLPSVPMPIAARSLPIPTFNQGTSSLSSSPFSLISNTRSPLPVASPPKPVGIRRRPRLQPKKDEVPAIAAGSKPFEKLEILVAEDTPLLRRLAVVMLRKLGAITHEASNGQEVVDAVMNRIHNKQPPFNCILMDCQMPLMDGYEACKAVRDLAQEAHQRTPIVALTANAMASDEHKCLHAGMDAFLTKPINQDYMIQVILQTVVPQVSQRASSNSKVLDVQSTEVVKNGYPPKVDLRVSVK
ncbi:hypothetical protein KC19_2G263600 [Ceratodon purpureus]|uniref:Histidine kinase n=1 Tax=Ceratodon purpureus TaxID=3225 RepID=A0A8T0IY81_CERPU|nr:hypothetical protein KC19_2G263600 [Ceratodon purpureus]